MKIPCIAPLLNYSLYGGICDNKANSARVELGLGLSLAINELLVTTAFVFPGLLLHIRAAHALHYDQIFPNLMMSVSGQYIAGAAHQCTGRFGPC